MAHTAAIVISWARVARSHQNEQNGLTERCKVILEMVLEMVALSCGLVVELDIHDVMSVLVGDFDNSYHVICCIMTDGY
jgi:hypothetical protein